MRTRSATSGQGADMQMQGNEHAFAMLMGNGAELQVPG